MDGDCSAVLPASSLNHSFVFTVIRTSRGEKKDDTGDLFPLNAPNKL